MASPGGADASMDEYARYVWPAYAIAAGVIGGLAIQSVAALRRRRCEAERLEARRPGRRRRDGAEEAGDDA